MTLPKVVFLYSHILSNAIVMSLKTFSALIGGNCTTWPCHNFLMCLAARVTIMLSNTARFFCDKKPMNSMINGHVHL